MPPLRPSYLLRSFPISSNSRLPRAFSTTPQPRASILFALNALSNSRETQHFNKISHLNRIEHSPPLKLIKTGEIDPHPLPTPPPKPATPLRRPTHSASRIWDVRALQVGRVILADHARQTSRLQKALERARRGEARRDALMAEDRATWQQEATRLRGEMRVAGAVILISIGTATALATWRFWPQGGRGVADSGETGREIAARAKEAVDVSEEASRGVAPVTADKAVQTVAPAAAVEPALATPLPPSEMAGVSSGRGCWKSLFWK
ncbi:hypothetical protein Tdes44962_MAKER07658 [Teratosphaeria destructans]|uniref:Uncharacterized protein n=1 Tax=Teratosphaeria destructans TaxID=418781 RepID=A0A9W7W5N2_9PEZI|nr:hypothetical protein Tdes44962_MAKER07658 [Teratosphaeria destructans]